MRMKMVVAMMVAAGSVVTGMVASGQTAPLPPPRSSAPKETETEKKPPDADDGRCDLCDSCSCVRKVCVPKPKEREIKKVCWGYTCEDFCIPGPSEYCGKKSAKDECGCWSYEVWKPTCAEIRTKKVPVKTEVKRKVPGVEWKPEERCAACRCRAQRDRVGLAGLGRLIPESFTTAAQSATDADEAASPEARPLVR